MSGSGQGRVYPYVGYISSVDVKPTRSGKNKGKKRADFVLLTREGAKNINVWWRTYKKHKAHIEEGRRVVVLAKKWTPDESKTFVPAETIVPIGQVVTDWSRLLVVKPHRATYGSMQQIEKVFDRMEPGEVSTILVVGSEESARKYKGPSVRLTPRRMRELSSRAEVQIR
jgi:DNA polymerase III alpha subunit